MPVERVDYSDEEEYLQALHMEEAMLDREPDVCCNVFNQVSYVDDIVYIDSMGNCWEEKHCIMSGGKEMIEAMIKNGSLGLWLKMISS